MIDHYDWAGGREAMLRFGPSDGPSVIVALPLFEEANRMRHFIVTILRMLAERGIGGALPDLPGTGESVVPTIEATLANWRKAYAAAVARLGWPAYSITIRGGALLDSDADVTGRWRFAPVDGETLDHEWRHGQIMAEAALGNRITLAETTRDGPPLTINGNLISSALMADIKGATYAPGRIVRLKSDRAAADRKLPGTPLWRRAEPGDDDALAKACADDIAGWIATCGA